MHLRGHGKHAVPTSVGAAAGLQHRGLTAKLLTPVRRAEAGTNTSVICMSAFWTQRRAILPSILLVLKPGVPLCTMKALICLVLRLRAHTTTTSAKVALPIQRLQPLSTQPPSTCTQAVSPCAAAEFHWVLVMQHVH